MSSNSNHPYGPALTNPQAMALLASLMQGSINMPFPRSGGPGLFAQNQSMARAAVLDANSIHEKTDIHHLDARWYTPKPLDKAVLFDDANVAEEENGMKREDFVCVLCLNMCSEPAACRSCKLPFCKTCLLDALQKKKECPKCRQAIDPSTLSIEYSAQGFISKFRATCPNRDKGCKWTDAFGEEGKNVHAHLLTHCEHQPVQCPQAGCAMELPDKTHVEPHLQLCLFKKASDAAKRSPLIKRIGASIPLILSGNRRNEQYILKAFDLALAKDELSVFISVCFFSADAQERERAKEMGIKASKFKKGGKDLPQDEDKEELQDALKNDNDRFYEMEKIAKTTPLHHGIVNVDLVTGEMRIVWLDVASSFRFIRGLLVVGKSGNYLFATSSMDKGILLLDLRSGLPVFRKTNVPVLHFPTRVLAIPEPFFEEKEKEKEQDQKQDVTGFGGPLVTVEDETESAFTFPFHNSDETTHPAYMKKPKIIEKRWVGVLDSGKNPFTPSTFVTSKNVLRVFTYYDGGFEHELLLYKDELLRCDIHRVRQDSSIPAVGTMSFLKNMPPLICQAGLQPHKNGFLLCCSICDTVHVTTVNHDQQCLEQAQVLHVTGRGNLANKGVIARPDGTLISLGAYPETTGGHTYLGTYEMNILKTAYNEVCNATAIVVGKERPDVVVILDNHVGKGCLIHIVQK